VLGGVAGAGRGGNDDTKGIVMRIREGGYYEVHGWWEMILLN